MSEGEPRALAPRPTLGALAGVFLTLGLTAFGGPAAHIAQMEAELVTRRRWLSRDDYLDMVSAANLLPGPTSTEVALHVGLKQGGAWGLLLAGLGFIGPAALLTGGLAAAYVAWGALPVVEEVLRWVKPVVAVVVWQALARLGLPKRRGIAAVAVALAMAGVPELLVFVVGGVLALASRLGGGRGWAWSGVVVWPALLPHSPSLPAIFGVFLKIGSVLYGSGYVLLAFLRTELVTQRGWITEAQLLDAVAVGQVTPGPLFSTATFLGYLLAGAPGAAAATLGIFLPSFAFVAVSGWLLPKVRSSPAARAFLDGVNAASIALMAVVSVQLTRAAWVGLAGVDAAAVGASVVAAVALWRGWLSSAALLGLAALLGILQSIF